MRALLTPDASWTTAGLFGSAFAALYGVIFEAWYRRRLFQQELEDEYE
ncbi:hypothetical protein [Actinomadura bangladeshensis]|nr:hypothetical protein [Actinomadura bangladeshensis]